MFFSIKTYFRKFNISPRVFKLVSTYYNLETSSCLLLLLFLAVSEVNTYFYSQGSWIWFFNLSGNSLTYSALMLWLQNMGNHLPCRLSVGCSRRPWKVCVTLHSSADQEQGGPGLNNLRSRDRASAWNLDSCPWPLVSPASPACSMPCSSFLCHQSWLCLCHLTAVDQPTCP